MAKGRNSNIEILRIIAMLMIVLDHYSSHGLFGLGSVLEYSANRYVANIAFQGKIGNALFVLISGYYMCVSRITMRKLFRIWAETAFYGLSFWAIFYAASKMGGCAVLFDAIHIHAGRAELLQSVMPIGHSTYWFITDYVVLMMVSPALNIVLDRLERKKLLAGLIIATIFWSVFPTFTRIEYGHTELIWWFILYLYAGYIRRYVELSGSNRNNVLLGAAAWLLYILSVCGRIYAGHVTGREILTQNANILEETNSPLTMLFGTEILIGFLKMPARHIRWINAIGGATFGVYLIHNNMFIKPFLWKYLLGLPESVYGTNYLIPHMIVSVIAVFAICTVIELVRQRTVERWYMAMYDRLEPRIHTVYRAFMDRGGMLMERILR